MKTPEDITVSLELAKELKENGYPQDSYFRYVKRMNGLPQDSMILIGRNSQRSDQGYAAPTASEIELPAEIDGYELTIIKGLGCYEVCYLDDNGHAKYKLCKTKLEDALSEMWLHLKKNNLI